MSLPRDPDRCLRDVEGNGAEAAASDVFGAGAEADDDGALSVACEPTVDCPVDQQRMWLDTVEGHRDPAAFAGGVQLLEPSGRVAGG